MVNGIAQRLPALKSHDVDIQNVTQTLQTTWGNLQRVQQSQRLIFNLAGQQKYVQITPWRDSLGLDWLVITVLPESDFMAQIHANTQRSLLLSLLALGLAVSISLVTARWITVTITNLSRAAAEIANGQLSQRVEVKGIRELKTLSQAFNQMATQLQSSFAALATANQALEHRVQERTAALQSANAQVLLLNQQLQADNVRMSAELDVTRRLQQLMLPKAEELAQVPGLDIAGFMEAAHEVGGDYYDVIPSDRQVTIGIGDVTGHGLESGVLMIMAQTAVRTLLAVNEQNPKRFFNALNQVVYQNSQRLSPGKNMTLVLLNYCDQHLYISGQHEDVLVFRANGSVEQVDTLELGMPLGLLEDIQEFVAQVKVQLQPGDGVVLYTDGITEAEGEQRSLYGYDRLIAVVKAHWQSSAQAIRQAVIDDVRSHIAQNPIHDDITLVVLKKLAEPS
jgi:sigma-B regulation protein RsbU (phosphoserine phosphatase)